MGHIHAAVMAEYAKDALETDKPWERWEFFHKSGEYQSLDSHPEWVVDNEYCRKPKTILINGHEVPEPFRTPLEIDDVYWTFTFIKGGVTNFYWSDDSECRNALKNGFVHQAATRAFQCAEKFHCSKRVNHGTRTHNQM